MPIRVDSVITIDSTELTRREWADLFASLTFVDKEEYEVKAYTYNSGTETVVIPRGALDLIPKRVVMQDLRSRPRMPKLRHIKELDAHGFIGQRAAVDAMLKYGQGQIRMPTGSGKTSCGCAFVAENETRTLILVHTRDIMRQWVERFEEELPDIGEVGIIQGSTFRVGHVTVAMAQTLKRHLDKGARFWRQFGAIVVDESAHSAASTWEWLLNVCPAYYRIGLSASDKRSDGRQKLVRFNIGPVVYRMPFRSQVPLTVHPIATTFSSRLNGGRYTQLVGQLARDEDRNGLVSKTAQRMVADGHIVLVLSRQIGHLERIADLFGEEMTGRYAIVTGRLPQHKRNELLDAMRTRELPCILATQLFEEGVDVPVIDCVMLAFPATDVTTLQKVGRATRKADGKTAAIVIDFVDPRVSVFARQWLQRRAWYKKSGIKVEKMELKRIGGQHGTHEDKGRRIFDPRKLRVARRTSARV